jgi:hypothetical protein
MLELIEVLLFFLDVIVEIVFAWGIERCSDAYGRSLFQGSFLTYVGLALLGACVGSLISQLVPRRILPTPVLRGGSLFLSPLVAGLVMKVFGNWRTGQGHQRTALGTFWGGAAFAFGMVLVRWLMVGRVP